MNRLVGIVAVAMLIGPLALAGERGPGGSAPEASQNWACPSGVPTGGADEQLAADRPWHAEVDCAPGICRPATQSCPVRADPAGTLRLAEEEGESRCVPTCTETYVACRDKCTWSHCVALCKSKYEECKKNCP